MEWFKLFCSAKRITRVLFRDILLGNNPTLAILRLRNCKGKVFSKETNFFQNGIARIDYSKIAQIVLVPRGTFFDAKNSFDLPQHKADTIIQSVFLFQKHNALIDKSGSFIAAKQSCRVPQF